MQKVFEACGYNFTVITPKNEEPHFIAKEVASELGYTQIAGLTKQFKKYGSKTLKLTHRNGLSDLKDLMNSPELLYLNQRSSIDKHTPSLLLISSSSLQEYLLRYATKPDAKEVGKKLYDYLSQVNIVLPTVIEQPLDEVEQMIMKLYPSHSESIEVSKEIQGWFESFVEVDPNYFNWNLSFRKESVYG